MSNLQLLYSALALFFQLGIHKSLAMESYAEDQNWRDGLPDYLVDGRNEKDKRHLAAMAKSGRLPMSHFGGKRVSESDKTIMDTVDRAEKYLMATKRNETENKSPELSVEQKRYVGAFLRSRGRPVSAFRGSIEPIGWDSDDDNPDKRNIAALARMGRLREIKSWPYGGPLRDEELEDTDCVEDGENQEEETNRIREKRYIAALARNGRLPPLRGFRPWWSDKRTKNQELYAWPPYRSPKSLTDKRIQKDIVKTTRCKKFAGSNYLSDEDNELGMDLSNFQKRNVGLLARKGLLVNRPFVP